MTESNFVLELSKLGIEINEKQKKSISKIL